MPPEVVDIEGMAQNAQPSTLSGGSLADLIASIQDDADRQKASLQGRLDAVSADSAAREAALRPQGEALLKEASTPAQLDRGQAIGLMLSTILPILAGAALGGKMGAFGGLEAAGAGGVANVKTGMEMDKEVRAGKESLARETLARADREEGTQRDMEKYGLQPDISAATAASDLAAGIRGKLELANLTAARSYNTMDLRQPPEKLMGKAVASHELSMSANQAIKEIETLIKDKKIGREGLMSALKLKGNMLTATSGPAARLSSIFIELASKIAVANNDGSRPSDFDAQKAAGELMTAWGGNLADPEGLIDNIRRVADNSRAAADFSAKLLQLMGQGRSGRALELMSQISTGKTEGNDINTISTREPDWKAKADALKDGERFILVTPDGTHELIRNRSLPGGFGKEVQ